MIRTDAARAAALVGSLLFASLAVACASTTVVNEAESPPPAADTPPPPKPEKAEDPKPEPRDPSLPIPSAVPPSTDKIADHPKDAAKVAKADGSSCDKHEECSSGICEGEGCGDGQGKCAPKDRQCTLDLRPYCGCDGKTFQAGGSCPKQRYSKKGACASDPPPSIKVKKP
jgi:hypothetical protein